MNKKGRELAESIHEGHRGAKVRPLQSMVGEKENARPVDRAFLFQ